MSARTANLVPALLSRSITRTRRPCIVQWLEHRRLNSTSPPPIESLRKHLRDEAKRKKAETRSSVHKPNKIDPLLDKWELTVGIEIHAELNTACKLFSPAPATSADTNGILHPNTHVALFDAAIPGSQPQFQRATLLPALRAALGLKCEVQRRSGWDRKHYFHWDQPNGYQITQYYSPLATNGSVTLTAADGVPASDLPQNTDSLTIGIKQVQLEQDTAKTTTHSTSTHHIDLNRAGHPLIEIITLPQIHSPQTAAALVRKIQSILKSVDACTTGMELGGLRADVNVSVLRRDDSDPGHSAYAGIAGLGQRTEIKNLASFAAIESAILAEYTRQIHVLESGGVVEGETRGWTLGATETTRLRGKEGEVDYRYLPDAELAPLVVGSDLVKFLKDNMPELVEETIERVVGRYGVSEKDARTLVSLDEGDRLEFMEETVALTQAKLHASGDKTTQSLLDDAKIGKTASNYILHELGALLTNSQTTWADLRITPAEIADILVLLLQKEITSRTAKGLLLTLHGLQATTGPASRPTVDQLVDEGNLRLRPLAEEDYISLAESIMAANPEMVAAVREKGQKGKVMWFVGQMVREGEDGTVEPAKAKQVVEKLLLGR